MYFAPVNLGEMVVDLSISLLGQSIRFSREYVAPHSVSPIHQNRFEHHFPGRAARCVAQPLVRSEDAALSNSRLFRTPLLHDVLLGRTRYCVVHAAITLPQLHVSAW